MVLFTCLCNFIKEYAMDENYLDTLLGEVSGKDKFNNDFDMSVDKDAGIDVDLEDFGSITLSDMDGFDELGDLDLDSLDLDDIDFDDLDMTKLEAESVNSSNDDDEDFDFDTLLEENDLDEASDTLFEEKQNINESIISDTQKEEQSDVSVDDFIDSIGLDDGSMNEDNDFTDNSHDDSFNEDVFEEADNRYFEDENEQVMMSEEELFGDSSSGGNADTENMDLDALFSALGIEDDTNSSNEDNYLSTQDDFDSMFASATMSDDMSDLDDIESIDEEENKATKKGQKKLKKEKSQSKGQAKTNNKTKAPKEGKKSIQEVLFGEPDEDDIEESALIEAKKAQKEEKKAKKQQAKEEKNRKKEALSASKQKAANEKKKAKDEKNKAKQEELRAELEEEKDAKKVPTVVVILVFLAFAIGAGTVVLGAKTFDYTFVIKKATDYFERQRYRLAYDEIAGVEVRKKDEDLKDRIYTVMYVERLYESYENNITLERYDKALDALLRGLEKYDVHYDEAVELGIADDINVCKAKIVTALKDRYGLSEEDAYAIIELDGQDYSKKIIEICEKTGVGQ